MKAIADFRPVTSLCRRRTTPAPSPAPPDRPVLVVDAGHAQDLPLALAPLDAVIHAPDDGEVEEMAVEQSRTSTIASVSRSARSPLEPTRELPNQCLLRSSGLAVGAHRDGALDEGREAGPEYHDTCTVASGWKQARIVSHSP